MNRSGEATCADHALVERSVIWIAKVGYAGAPFGQVDALGGMRFAVELGLASLKAAYRLSVLNSVVGLPPLSGGGAKCSADFCVGGTGCAGGLSRGGILGCGGAIGGGCEDGIAIAAV